MERKLKDTPQRLPVIFQRFGAPLYFVTFNTLLKRPLLANNPVHTAFRNYSERGLEFNVVTGRYVLMLDHIHVFVRIGRDMTLRRWEIVVGVALSLWLNNRAAGSTLQPIYRGTASTQPIKP